MADLTAPLVSAGLAAVGGITYIAYKHPDGYERLHWLLRVLTVGTLVGLVIWDNAVTGTANGIFPLVDPSKKAEMEAVIAALRLYVPTGLIISGAANIYFEFLGVLPMILAEKTPPRR